MSAIQTRTRTVTLGQLVAAAYERASQVTAHPLVASAIATRCVQAALERTGRDDLIGVLARTGRELGPMARSRRLAHVSVHALAG